MLEKRQRELQKVAETKKTQEGLLVKLKSELLFDTAKADVKPEAEQKLAELGEILSKYEKDEVNVGGFTDSVGTDEFNKELSEKRAQAVRDILVKQGVDSSRINVFGFGEETPIANNSTEKGRTLNRRVELAIQVPNEQS